MESEFKVYLTLYRSEPKDYIKKYLKSRSSVLEPMKFGDFAYGYIEEYAENEYLDNVLYDFNWKLRNIEIQDLDFNESLIISTIYYESEIANSNDVLEFTKDWYNKFRWESDNGQLETGEETYLIVASEKLISELRSYCEGGGVLYEEFYDLKGMGIEIGAEVSKIDFDNVSNRIILKKGTKRSSIDCVHTAFVYGTLDEVMGVPTEDLEFLIESSEGKVITDEIDLEGHFFALNSFVQGIAEMGLSEIMRESYDHSEKNYGFNTAMHSQFMSAICKIDEKLGAELVKNFMIEVLENNDYEFGLKWLHERIELIRERFNIAGFLIKSDFDVTIYQDYRLMKNDCIDWLMKNEKPSKTSERFEEGKIRILTSEVYKILGEMAFQSLDSPDDESKTKEQVQSIKEFIVSALKLHSYDFGVKWLYDRINLICQRYDIAGFLIKSNFKIKIFRDPKDLAKYCWNWLISNGHKQSGDVYHTIKTFRNVLKRIAFQSMDSNNEFGKIILQEIKIGGDGN